MNFSEITLLLCALLFPPAWSQDTRDYKEFLNTRANPCEDFYQYACGKWTPKNIEAVDVLTDQKLENFNILKQRFARQSAYGDSLPREFYHLCMKSKTLSEEEIRQIYLSVPVEISQWPYLNETFKPSTFNWLQVAAKLRRYRVDTLFQLSIQRNWKNSEQHIIYLTPSKKIFEGQAHGDEAFMHKTYVKYLLLDVGVRVRKANRVAQDVVDFEVELNTLSRDVKDELVDPISLSRLIERVPSINWVLYFETLLEEPIRQSQLIVVQIDWLRKLDGLLSRTKVETIALFELTRFIRHYYDRLGTPHCMEELNSRMPLSVSNQLVALCSTCSHDRVEDVFRNIRDEFRQQINYTVWYDTKSKNELLAKLDAIGFHIGLWDTNLEYEQRHEPETQIDPQSFHKSRMLLEKSATKRELKLLTNRSKSGERLHKPLNVNAYYKLTTNSLETPLGLLRPPIYREPSNWPQVMGSLGSIIAHELIHGFDYDGQNYDKGGNVKTESNPRAVIQFGLRANCFIDQYGGTRMTALNEDIADNAGMRLAYDTYNRLRGDYSPYKDSMITGDQLFFISFAQVWCRSEGSTSRPRDHSSHKDRVNNVVSNLNEFAEAFSCPRGRGLNPDKKCQIWP